MHIFTETKYPYKWGQEVVEKFVEQYSRGTSFLAYMLGISREKCIKLLILRVCQDNQLRWRTMKRTIKLCERENAADYQAISLRNRRFYLTTVMHNCESEELDRLIAEESLDDQTELF